MASTLYLFVIIVCITISTSFDAGPRQCFSCEGNENCYDIENITVVNNKNCSVEEAAQVLVKIIDAFGLNASFPDLAKILNTDKVWDGTWTCINFAFDQDLIKEDKYAIRSCAPKELFSQDICESLNGIMTFIDGTMDYCKTCDDPNCNSAITLETTPIVLFSIIAVALKLII